MNHRSQALTGWTMTVLNFLPLFTSVNSRVTALTRFGAAVSLLPILIIGTYYSLAYPMSNQAPGETGLSALEWLRTGVIGNPYITPTGPTAHTAPGTVALLITAYGLLDGNTATARIVLSLVAVLEYAASAALVLLFCKIAKLRFAATFAAVLLGCLLPVHLYNSAVNYRQWDQPTSALLLTALLLMWLRPEIAGPGWLRPTGAIVMLGGVGGLFAPALPLVAIFAACALGARRRDWRPAALGAVLILCAMAPWAVRNQLVLGTPVLTRSNFGLELAVGNHDAATGVFDLATAPPIHPHDSIPAAERVVEVGEIRYMQEMRHRAISWIQEHPLRFAELCMRRARLLLFPNQADRDPVFRQLKLPVLWVTSGLSLLAVLLVAARRQPVMPWLICIGLPLAPYVLTHASERYAFPTYFAMICLIATGADQLPQRKRDRDEIMH